ncbi:unnamed protein product [marine sediment metagenome]|uniref:PEGA domain-containing protein n=1 Tax=marine sediment metagenome TaxID=412755 RepID=X1HFC9_9ZZZZ
MGILFTILMGFLFTITLGFLFTIALGIQFTISTYLGMRISSSQRHALRLEIDAVKQSVLAVQKGKLVISLPPRFSVYFKGTLEQVQGDEFGEYVKELPPGEYDLMIIRSGFLSFEGPVIVHGGESTELGFFPPVKVSFPYMCVNKFIVTSGQETVAEGLVGFDYREGGTVRVSSSAEELAEKVVRGTVLKKSKFFAFEPRVIDVTPDLYASINSEGTSVGVPAFGDGYSSIYQWPDGKYSANVDLFCPDFYELGSLRLGIKITMEKKGDRVTFMATTYPVEQVPWVVDRLNDWD